MSSPDVPQKAPYAVNVEAGKTYYWCSCGKSASQPFCDGKHKGSEFTPMAYDATRTGEVYFCGCKSAVNRPLCDGTHAKI
jgi:CDGSH iron-sulfur domain-containing protein 3